MTAAVDRRHRIRLILAFTAVYLIWGSTYLAIRFAIESLPPLLMGGIRFTVAGAIMYTVAPRPVGNHPTAGHWRAAFVVGTLLLLGGNGSVVLAERRIASGLAALIVATEPLWVVLIDWARPRGTAPTRGDVIGLGLGFTGVGLLMAPGQVLGTDTFDLLGMTLVIFAAVSWAAGSVYSRNADRHPSALVSTGMTMLAGGIMMIGAGTLAGEWNGFEWQSVTTKSWAALVYLTVFGSLIAFTAYLWLLENTTLAKASTYAYVNPVVAVVLGWLLAEEGLSLRIVGAAGIILTGVVIVVTSHGPMVETDAPPAT